MRVALKHETTYEYDRPVTLGPQLVRLRPAPHCRADVTNFSLDISPRNHLCHWQQDPFGNFLARILVPEKTEHFTVEARFTVELNDINPFDFFVEPTAESYPFHYETQITDQTRPFQIADAPGPQLSEYLSKLPQQMGSTIQLLVAVNQQVQSDIRYLTRDEPGVQSCEETLQLQSGSCRDSAWLLVQILRNLGFAARFVSGYLIQLNNDEEHNPLESSPNHGSLDQGSLDQGSLDHDSLELHAWTEAYIPGAGWIGLDPTAGLLTGSSHLPVACALSPHNAAPITGTVEECLVDFRFSVMVERLPEGPPLNWLATDFSNVMFHSEN